MAFHRSHGRQIKEGIFGSGIPAGGGWIRRAVEKTGVDVSHVTGSWEKKLFIALGGDITMASGPWMRSIAYLLGVEEEPGSWEAKVAKVIEETGGIVNVTFDSDTITMDNTNLTFDKD